MRHLLFCLLFLLLLLANCKTNVSVVNGGWIQKRKYNSGWHVERSSERKQPAQAEVEHAPTAADETVAQALIQASANKIDASISAYADQLLLPAT